jgi:polyhydroxyalkanoate synthesis regulator phasin
MSLSNMTRDRAQKIVKELVKSGEIQREQAAKRVEELMERSRKSTEELMELISKEVRRQVKQLRLVTLDDLQKMLERLGAAGPLGKGLTDAVGRARGNASRVAEAVARSASPSRLPKSPQ